MYPGKEQIPRVAVIGAGYWGKNLVRNFSDLGALAAVCDSEPQRRAELSRQYPRCVVSESRAPIMSDATIQAVAIATPAESHGHLVREALLAGKDVFVEKPLCLSLSTGKELITLAREKSRLVMVGHLLWYHPAIIKLKELIDAGELGRIQYIYSNRVNLGKIRREENILWSFAPHDISVILGLLNEMPDAVEAQGGNYLHPQRADATVSLLSFPSGVRAHIFVSWLHPFKEQKLVVVGDRKMAVFDDLQMTEKLCLYAHTINWKNHEPVPERAEPQFVFSESLEPLREECVHFLDCIRLRKSPRTDGKEGLRVLEVLNACQAALTPKPKPRVSGNKISGRAFFAHESAFIDEGVKIGDGTSIWHVSHILRGSRIGRNCKMGQNVVIGPNVIVGDGVKIQNNVLVCEGVTLSDDVFCGPNVGFTNVINPRSEILRASELKQTLVKRGASLGANCIIICGNTIGEYAFVGAGAVVTKDVPDYALVVGNPARISGWVCKCGVKLSQENGLRLTCGACGVVYDNADGQPMRVEETSVRTA